MAKETDTKVHIDHLIPREGLRWVDPQKQDHAYPHRQRDPMTKLRYRDLENQKEFLAILSLLRKPDFQRETSAWSPELCVSLLESIVNSLIIPSLIIWKSPENSLLYILDGAHRVSVLLAWIRDDWGDKAPEGYYERHEYSEEIRQAAQIVRQLVRAKIGSYEDFITAGEKYVEASKRGSPQDILSTKEFWQGLFYIDVIGSAGFHIQEVSGNYEVAEASFLKINRGGQPLDDWETTLIENRNSSYARAVMSVANAGAGRYWPENTQNPLLDAKSESISHTSGELHKIIFVPPLRSPINDVNVPFIAATRYFPKHAYLLELFPVIMNMKDVNSLFGRDKDCSPDAVIANGYELIERCTIVFKHLTGDRNNPLSLAIVPLFYFYTDIGRYVRSSLYGFITWLMSGDDETIRTRKIIFSAHRGRLEQIMFLNDVSGAITRKAGSGTRAIDATVQFYQNVLELLISDSSPVDSKLFQSKLLKILSKLTTPNKQQTEITGRLFTNTQKSKINLEVLFKSAVRCEICGGILDLKMGLQYDHITPHSEGGATDPRNGRPSHPFCNNQSKPIEAYREGRNLLKLPLALSLETPPSGPHQLSLFDMFNNTTFPDEGLKG
jgi:hypothetical protein